MYSSYLRFKKFISALTIALFAVVNPLLSFAPAAYASEGDAPDSVTSAPADAPLDQPSDNPAPSDAPATTDAPAPSDSPAPTDTVTNPDASVLPEPTPVPDVTPTPSTSSTTVDDSVWQILPNGKALTKDAVNMSTTYVAPQNPKVTVHFTQLPDTAGNLTIQEIKLSADQQKQLGALSDTAYDISSNMENGTFKYDLTLPNPAGNANATVKYSEDVASLDSAQVVTQKKSVDTDEDTITITGLNHFTVFTVSADTNSATGTGAYTATTGPTIVETAIQQITTGTIILNAPAGFEFKTSGFSLTITPSGPGTCSGGQHTVQSSGISGTTSAITATISAQATGSANCKSTLTFSGIQMRPTAGTPLSSGDITRSGTASIGVATFNGNTFTETFGAINNSVSTLTATPASVPADGSTTSTIIATVLDQFGNPVSGQSVTLAKTAGTGTPIITTSPATTNASGVATFTVKSTTADTDTFTASGSTYSKTANVAFTGTDTTPPVITILGSNPVSVEAGTTYADAGAAASDNIDGNITANIVTTGLPVDTSVLGTHLVNYNVDDAAHNHATQATRTVNVVDTTAPAVPTLVSSPSDGAKIKKTTAFLNWSSVTDLSSPVKYRYQSSLSNAVDANNALSSSPFTAPLQPTTQIDARSSADNLYYWQVQACDSLSNCSAWSGPWSVTIDGTAPTTTDSGTDSAWHNSNVTVTLTCNDGTGTGCDVIYWNTDGTDPTIASHQGAGNTVVLSSDGQYTVKYFSVDAVGNAEAVKTAANVVKIDMTAPDTTINSGPSGTIATDSPSFTFSSSEVNSTFECQMDGAGFSACTSPMAYSGLSQGAHTFDVRAIDQANNVDPTPATQSFTVDTVAPTTTSSGIDASWHNTDVQVTLSCSDATSGCATTYYTTDGSVPTVLSAQYSAPFTLSVTGTYPIKYYSVDAVGNVEAVQDGGTVMIDTVLPSVPVIGAIISPTNNPVVAWAWGAASDADSGIQNYVYTLKDSLSNIVDSGTTALTSYSRSLVEGAYTFFVHSVDNANNVSADATSDVTVDITGPDITVPADIAGVEATSSSGAVVTYVAPTATDAVDGTDLVTCDMNSGDTFPIGTTTVHCSSTDTATNASNKTFNVTVVDTTAPSLPGTPTTTSPTADNTPTWNWTASTDVVGVDHYVLYWDTVAGGETYNSGSIPAGTTSYTHTTALADGTWYAKVKAYDAANNESVSGNGSVLIDTTAPVLQTFTSTTSNGNYGPTNAINITATYNEGLKAGSTATAVLDNGVSVVLNTISGDSISGTYTVGATGSHEDSSDLTVSSLSSESVSDALDNTRTNSPVSSVASNIADTSDIVVDTTAPTAPVAHPVAGDYYSYQTVTLTSDETVSTPVSIYYTIDGSDPATSATRTLYTVSGVSIDHTLTLRAIGYDSVNNASDPLSASYTIAPIISNVSSNANINPSSERVITWTTDIPSTSRVVYGTTSVSPLAGVPVGTPDYGYTFSSSTFDTGANQTTNHSVTITGLNSFTTYYFRVVSSEALENASDAESSFGTEATQGNPGPNGDSGSSSSSSSDSGSSTTGKVLGATTKAPTPTPGADGYTGTPVVLGTSGTGSGSYGAGSGAAGTAAPSVSPTPSVSPSPEASPTITPESTPAAKDESGKAFQFSWWWLLLVAALAGGIWYWRRNNTTPA